MPDSKNRGFIGTSWSKEQALADAKKYLTLEVKDPLSKEEFTKSVQKGNPDFPMGIILDFSASPNITEAKIDSPSVGDGVGNAPSTPWTPPLALGQEKELNVLKDPVINPDGQTKEELTKNINTMSPHVSGAKMSNSYGIKQKRKGFNIYSK